MLYLVFGGGIVLGVVVTLLIIHFGGFNQTQILIDDKNEMIKELTEKHITEQQKCLQINAQLAKEQARNELLSQNHKNETNRWEQINEQNRVEFENLVARLSKQNSDYLKGSNQEQMKFLLDPLKERINRFEEKIDKSTIDRNSLKEEIKRLSELNVRISEEATNLTKALKGDNKSQGTWGELILEKVLERSGLQNGVEYETQYSTTNDEGNRLQPDVIIQLPESKHIVVDSKVSLVAYERYTNADEEQAKNQFLKEHLISLKTHIKTLSDKSYNQGLGIHSPEFVLMFLPIEASFSVAVQEDIELFNYAWDRKIVIVSPTTLLATLRTIASVWKQEKQTKNALEIAQQSGALYDKFYRFVEDMDGIGKSMDKSREVYDKAMNKLKTGTGNLLTRAEKIKELGAKTKK